MAISLAPENAKFWHSKGLAYQSQAEENFKATSKQDIENVEAAIEMF